MLGDSVEIDNSVAKMNPVPGNSYDPLDEKYVFTTRLFGWLVEDDDIAAPDVSIMHEWDPVCSGSHRLSIDHHVIAHKQRTRHGRGGDNEVLK
jgi:hypothetical protein